jgi:hypothetical protein
MWIFEGFDENLAEEYHEYTSRDFHNLFLDTFEGL